jgi:DNA-directed RNA polymerase specialized sigma24 family protein
MTNEERNAWVLAHLDMAKYETRRMCGRVDADAEQECVTIMLGAVEHWRNDKGSSLKTYVRRCIRNRLTSWRAEWGQRPGIRIPWVSQRAPSSEWLAERIARVKAMRRDENDDGYMPTEFHPLVHDPIGAIDASLDLQVPRIAKLARRRLRQRECQREYGARKRADHQPSET